MKKKFVVKSMIENVFVNRYSLYYRDCIKILKFFMKHEFFANNLIYTFIRKYEITTSNETYATNDDIRI